jgi:hypothetical protein
VADSSADGQANDPRTPTTETSARVLLSSIKERRTKALVQALAALAIGGSRPSLELVHAVRVAVPERPVRLPSSEERRPPGAEPGRQSCATAFPKAARKTFQPASLRV